MKPRSVVLQAFGAYLNKTAVDFTRFDDNPLFLITGPTGCGKTSILDGMSFALYGHATGSVRDVRDMRNTASPKNLDTSVSFEFELDGKIYRFDRSIRVREKKLRAGGTEDVTEYEAACYIKEADSWNLICSGNAPVREEATNLLGFSYEQFSQVVVLPQGEFRRLLTANSAEKQKILETLFGAKRWQDFVRTLADMVKETQADLNTLKLQCDATLGSTGAQDREGLARITTDTENQLKVLTEDIKEKNELYAKVSFDYNKALQIENAFRELETAENKQKAFKLRINEIQEKRGFLENALLAEQVNPYYEAFKQAADSEKEARAKLEAAKNSHRKAQEDAERAHLQMKELETVQEKINQTSAEITRLEALEQPLRSFEQAKQEWGILQDRHKKAGERCGALKSIMDETTVKIADLRDKIQLSFEKYVKLLPEMKVRATRLREAADRIRKQSELEKKTAEMNELIIRKRTEYSKAKQRLDYQKAILLQLEEAARRDAAAQLAQGLADGYACPVCGATEHPNPASPAPGAPDEKTLAFQKDAVEKLEEECQKIRDEGTELRALYDGEINRLAEMREENQKTGFKDAGEIENEIKRLREAILRSESVQERQSALEKEYTALLEQHKEREAEFTAAQKERDELLAQASSARGRVQELMSSVPEEIRDPSLLKQRIETLKSENEKASREAVQIQENERNVVMRLAGCKEALKAAEAAAGEAAGRLSKTRSDFEKIWTERQVPENFDINQFRMDENARSALSDEINAYDRESYTLTEKIKQLGESLDGIERPDIDTLEKNMGSIRKNIEDAAARKGRLDQTLQSMRAATANLEKLDAQTKQKQEQFAIKRRIYGAVDGNNPLKTPIQQFVLGLMLDDILMSANMHLTKLSRGQYSLVRSGELQRGGGTKGLDLSVNDAWRGGIRNVSTLSGGEMFLASLSLAFGLSDVVQSYAGGIHLDSIFIDEGFGSLDTETLDIAMQALMQIRNSGRIVGIISHVNDLKEQIPARIEVSKSAENGSRVKIITG